MNNWCICWFSRIFLLGILIFKGLTALRLYKLFGVKGLMWQGDCDWRIVKAVQGSGFELFHIILWNLN
jgi:hypothetical protein